MKLKMLLIESSNGKLSNLTSISTGGGNHKLNSVAASAYEKMIKAAKEDGVEWGITDSYRTFEVQDKIFDWDHYKSTGKKRKKGTSGTPVAYPGKSNHGWGSAVDLKVKYDDKSHKWLTANASKFGFSNPFKSPKTEPWHWEHLDSAKSMKSGTTPVEEIPVVTDKKPDTTSSDVTDKKPDTTSSDVTDKKPDTTSSDVTDKKPDTEIKTNDKTDTVNDFDSLIKNYVSSKFNIPKKDEPKDKEEEVVAEELIQEIFRIKDIMKKIL
jgi:hypothetical protein